MSKQQPFKIRPGIYNIPNYGRVVATGVLPEKAQVELYLHPSFPFIELQENGASLLKKEKLTEKQLAGLLLKSKTVAEVELLLQVKSTKALKNIAETRLKVLQQA